MSEATSSAEVALTPGDIIELHMDSDEALLFAWGIHQPEAFIAAAYVYGVDADAARRVRHEAYVRLRRHPQTGKFATWYEPVMGEPNATVLYPA